MTQKLHTRTPSLLRVILNEVCDEANAKLDYEGMIAFEKERNAN